MAGRSSNDKISWSIMFNFVLRNITHDPENLLQIFPNIRAVVLEKIKDIHICTHIKTRAVCAASPGP